MGGFLTAIAIMMLGACTSVLGMVLVALGLRILLSDNSP